MMDAAFYVKFSVELMFLYVQLSVAIFIITQIVRSKKAYSKPFFKLYVLNALADCGHYVAVKNLDVMAGNRRRC